MIHAPVAPPGWSLGLALLRDGRLLSDQLDMREPFALGRQQLLQPGIEGDQFALALDRECKQVRVRHLAVAHQAAGAQARDFGNLHIERKERVMAVAQASRQQVSALRAAR